jgi:hypothetical protein
MKHLKVKETDEAYEISLYDPTSDRFIPFFELPLNTRPSVLRGLTKGYLDVRFPRAGLRDILACETVIEVFRCKTQKTVRCAISWVGDAPQTRMFIPWSKE